MHGGRILTGSRSCSQTMHCISMEYCIACRMHDTFLGWSISKNQSWVIRQTKQLRTRSLDYSSLLQDPVRSQVSATDYHPPEKEVGSDERCGVNV